jgi:hypothetical protein
MALPLANNVDPGNLSLIGSPAFWMGAPLALVGAIRGVPTVADGTEVRNLDWDGKIIDVVGMDYVVAHRPVITVELLEIATATADEFFQTGSTAGTVGSTTTITPPAGGLLLAAAGYLTAPTLRFPRADGKIIEYGLERGYCKAEPVFAELGQGAWRLTISGRGALTATANASPLVVRILDAP